MSAQRKQYADLIRHRELNALRRLMVGRHVPSPSVRPTLTGQGGMSQATQATVLRIDELEQQMNHLLLERVSSTYGHSQTAREFLPTQIVASNAPSAPTLHDGPEILIISEAAQHFAQQHDFAAHQLLTSALAANGSGQGHVPTWLVLFDFYRATGQAAPFEALALDFSVRFGRSTPAWVSLPDLVAPAQAAISNHAASTIAATWVAPAQLDEQSLMHAQAILGGPERKPQALVLDWRLLVDVQPTAWPKLQDFFSALAAQRCECTLLGLPALMLTFDATQQASVLAQLALHRCLNQFAAFEALALDYCTTFEVSPPDWQTAQCHVQLQELSLQTGLPVGAQPRPELATWELAGDIVALPSGFYVDLPTVTRLEIQCHRWVRCSPAAAQALKAWSENLKNRNIQVVLQGVHRLIAAYLLSQGVYEFAKVVIRKD